MKHVITKPYHTGVRHLEPGEHYLSEIELERAERYGAVGRAPAGTDRSSEPLEAPNNRKRRGRVAK